RHQPRLPLRLDARRDFLGLAIVAHCHRVRYGSDGLYSPSETTVVRLAGDSLRFVCRHWCFGDHPLVLGFCGRRDRRLGRWNGGRERISWENIEHLNIDPPTPSPPNRRADMHGFDLSSDALRYSPLWYRGSNAIVDAVRYARSCSHSHHAVIRVY